MANLGTALTTRFGGSSFWEMEPYRESYRSDASDATRTLLCKWSERRQFASNFLGYDFRLGTSLVRSLPEQHPDRLELYALDMEVQKGIGAPKRDTVTNLIHFRDGTDDSEGYAVCSVKYWAPPYTLLTNGEKGSASELVRYVQRECVLTSESLPIPGNWLKWVAAGTPPIMEPVAKAFALAELTYTWYRVPLIPSVAFSYQSTVNTTVFDAASLFTTAGWGVGTLLYLSPTIKQYRPANPVVDGQFVFDIAYKLYYRPSGWNNLFRRVPGSPATFVEATSTGSTVAYVGSANDGKHLFNDREFADLFDITK